MPAVSTDAFSLRLLSLPAALRRLAIVSLTIPLLLAVAGWSAQAEPASEPARDVCNLIDDDGDGELNEDVESLDCPPGERTVCLSSCDGTSRAVCRSAEAESSCAACAGGDGDGDGDVATFACGVTEVEHPDLCNAVDDDRDLTVNEDHVEADCDLPRSPHPLFQLRGKLVCVSDCDGQSDERCVPAAAEVSCRACGDGSEVFACAPTLFGKPID